MDYSVLLTVIYRPLLTCDMGVWEKEVGIDKECLSFSYDLARCLSVQLNHDG